MEIALRAARRDEASMLASIQAEASVAALAHIFPPDRYPFPHDEVQARWEEFLGDAEVRVVVAEAAAPVGLAAVRPAWLDGLYVVPAAWGTGVAGALHDRALAEHGPGEIR